MRCEDCEKEARSGDAFCRQCGAKLGGEKAPSAAGVAAEAAAEPGEKPEGEAGGGEPLEPTPGKEAEPVAGEEGAPPAGEEAAPGEQEAASAEAGPGPGEPAAAPLVPPVPPVPPPTLYPPPSAPRPKPRRTSGWAVASLVLGILSFMCLPFIGAVVAIVFGAVAKGGIKRSKDDVGGSGLATAGIVLGIVNLSLLIVFAAVLVPWTLMNIGETKTVTRTVATQGAESVSADLEIHAGDLKVGGGAGNMFDGTFTYNVKHWEPEIDYGVSQGLGELSVKQGGDWWVPTFWFIRNEWDLKFKDTVPLDLSATLSSGDGDFDLKNLSLRSLDVNASSGDIAADLSGNLPELRRISIDGSSGDIDLDLQGKYQTYIQLDIENSSGDIGVNLVGQWESTLGANIQNSSGDVTIHVPKDVGVRVRVRTRSGDINAPGMKMDSQDGDGAVYVNESFRRSLITLQIDVEVSSGDIILLLEE